MAGFTVASAGDVDGDGRGDVIATAIANDDNGMDAGSVYVVLGKDLGSEAVISLSDANRQYMGEKPEDFAGFSVANAGDLDGDGLDDLLIGAVGEDSGGSDAGSTYVVLSGK
jgi:hypothetical protein